MKKRECRLDSNDRVSNTFLALNYINISKNYSSLEIKDKVNIKKVWEVFLNPIKYEDQINDFLKNKVFAKAYFLILKNEGSIYYPKLSAASNDKVFSRSSNDFEMEIIKSNKSEDVYYLIVRLIKDFKLPLLNLYVICDNKSQCKKLPQFSNKQAQMLIKNTDDFFNLITNPNSEIFIR
jgi:hypothetical protein